MKKIFISIAAIGWVSGSAIADGMLANVFNCTGSKKTKVDFTSSSIVGKPTFEVTYKGKQINTTDAIKMEKTSLGQMVTITKATVTVKEGEAGVLGVTRYTMLIPQVWVRNLGDEAKVDTYLIKTEYSGTKPHSGAEEQYSISELQCSAKAVNF